MAILGIATDRLQVEKGQGWLFRGATSMFQGDTGIAGRDARRSWQSLALPPIDSKSKKARDGFFAAQRGCFKETRHRRTRCLSILAILGIATDRLPVEKGQGWLFRGATRMFQGDTGIAGRDACRSWQSLALPPIDSKSKKARDGFFDV